MKNIYVFLLCAAFLNCTKSTEGEADIIPAVPLAPTELKTTVISKDQIDLTWKDNSTNETDFKIERKTDSGNFIEIGSTAADVTTFSDKSVSLNTNYTYRVFSFNKGGKSIVYSNEALTGLNLSTARIDEISNINFEGATIKPGYNGGYTRITSFGVVWDTAPNPTESSSFKWSSSTYEPNIKLRGLNENTKYYVRYFVIDLLGISYSKEFNFTTSKFPFGTVIGANNRVWMDRNLGATTVAATFYDQDARGWLYQWGRGTDGHQVPYTYGSINTLSNTDNPIHSSFIFVENSPFNWRSPANDLLWQGGNGKNNPCPSGFRIPTVAEWEAEIKSWQYATNAGAFQSVLKLPPTGHRTEPNVIVNMNVAGNYWASDVAGDKSSLLFFNSTQANITTLPRFMGLACRCIKM